MAYNTYVCLYCGEAVEKNIAVKATNTRYAHQECENNKEEFLRKKEHEKREKAKNKRDKQLIEFGNESEEELIARRRIYDFVVKVFGFKGPGPRIIGQVKEFKEKRGYTYEGILRALKYHYEIKHGDIRKANESISIVPYVYADAQAYYKKFGFKQEQIADSVIEQLNKDYITYKFNKAKPTAKKITAEINLDDLKED